MGNSLLSCRDVLWFMTFCGFGVNYMLRTNLNLAIVAMVVPRGESIVATQCGKVDYTSIASWHNVSSSNDSSILSVTSRTFHQKSSEEVRFDWNEYEQAVVLGAYYWIHWVTQLPGGLLARRYGTKLVFGWANLSTALLGMLIPVLTRYHLYALVSLRVLQGFISGVVWPSMHDMTAKWIPQNERGRFVSAYLGSSVGAAITYPLCALCIDWYGWEAALYASSLIGVICCADYPQSKSKESPSLDLVASLLLGTKVEETVQPAQGQQNTKLSLKSQIISSNIAKYGPRYCFWYFLVFNTPQEHPRISDTERKYLSENLGSITNNDAPAHVPWKRILMSGPLWVTTIAHWGGVWGFLTFMTEAPTYLTYVHGWNINATGILSGLPHLLRMIFSYFFGIMTDWLLRTNKMTLTNVRKLATFVCTAVQGILTLGLAFSGCEPYLAIFFIMAGTAVNGAVSAGTLANLVDLSPNYASVLLGFAGLITASAGFISPTIVGILTNYNQTIEQWRLVFLIAAANLAVSFVVYMTWGTSDEQPWNSEGMTAAASAEELQKLKLDSQKKSEEENSNTDNGKNTSVDSSV